MSDAVKSETPDPLATAKAHGYVEPESPSREERIKTLIVDAEHAMNSNSPISLAMLAELKDLLSE